MSFEYNDSTQEIEIFKGDTVDFNMTFTNDDGDAIDLTGATIYFTIKEKKSDADINALVQKVITEHSNPSGGISSIYLSKDDTNIAYGNYYYDIQLNTSNDRVQTVIPTQTNGFARFKVIQDITRS